MSNKINSYHVTKNVSFISAIPEVRKKMVEFQRQMASGKNVVLEGRDIVQWKEMVGLVITPLDTHLMSAIIGLYFGGSLVKK